MAKIAVLITDIDCGGAQRVTIDLIDGFLSLGHEVDLLIIRSGGALTNEIPKQARTFILSSPTSTRAQLIANTLRGVHNYLRDNAIDAILSSITGANLIAVASRMLSSKKPRLIIRHENTGSNTQSRIYAKLIAKLYPRADAIITISDQAKEDLHFDFGIPRAKIHIIGNPINISRIHKLSLAQPEHPWLSDDNVPVFLAVGRFYHQKDFSTLIRAFARARSAQPARLIILGDGPERTKLESLSRALEIASDVDMPGTVQNPYPWMKASSVFVLSSLWEGLPIALLEAMALGMRIVATDCRSGPKELLEKGRLGILTPVADTERMAQAMIHALASPPDPGPVISKAAQYSAPGIVRAHLDVLDI